MKTNLLLFSILIFQLIYSQDGSLDNSFGTNGIIINDISNNLKNDSASSIIVKNDGSFLVSGNSINISGDSDIALAQYNSNGTLDTSFGNNGITTLDLNGLNDQASTSIFQSDGKIITVGTTNKNVFVARFNSNGTIDTSYATNGFFIYDSGSDDFGISISILPSNKILIGCRISLDYGIIKLTETGVFDTLFGINGITITDLGSNDALSDIKLQSDNKILVTGTSVHLNPINPTWSYNKALIRYNSDGTLDNTFNSNGIIFTSFENGTHESGDAIIIQPDGKIIVCGSSYVSLMGNDEDDNFTLARYNLDGSIDTSFGNNGVSIVDFGTDLELCTSALIQINGKIIIGGYVIGETGNNFNFGLARYNTDGSIDVNFGINGIVITDLNNNSRDRAYSMAFQNNQLLLTGYSQLEGSTSDFAIARYIIDGSLGTNDFIKNSNTYLIHPNPVTENITIINNKISNEKIDIEIYSIGGKKIKSISNHKLDYNQDIPLDFLTKGVYLLKIWNGRTKETLKIIKR